MQVPYLLDFLQSLKSARLDDFVDRLHYLSATALLTFFALLIGSKQTFGEPLTCMIPSQFPDSWNKYVHQFCYVSGTYQTESEWNVDAKNQTIKNSLNYYQWVPYVIAVQAFFFYVPHLLWLCLLSLSNVDFKTTIERCVDSQKKSNADRLAVINDVATALHSSRSFNPWGKWATLFYIMSKMLNLINVSSQLFVMNKFVGNNQFNWAWKIVVSMLRDQDWHATGLFPRISFCDFEKNTLGNLQNHTVQCVLMINMLNEKAFVIIDVCLFFLLIITMINLIHSTYTILFTHTSIITDLRSYVKYESLGVTDKQIRSFVENVLHWDGCLLLRFVGDHAGKLTAIQLAGRLLQQSRVNELTEVESRLPEKINANIIVKPR
ncbi:Innexin [Aphelenchoides besseyi]|nr:Innexin [Aphelenchoides besseyi]KAI6210755.1 Innexin [Aphelenchoides besseyi]